MWERWATDTGDAIGAHLESFLTDPTDEPDAAKREIEVAMKLADD